MLLAVARSLIVGLSAALLAGVLHPARAAPPASCVSKFVGSWTVTVVATGQTYNSQIRADGTLSSACFMCAPVQNWTCNGNTFILLGPGSATHTLSADGRSMAGGCCRLARLGPPPAPPNVAAAKPAPTVPTASPNQASTPSKSGSCGSDISGIAKNSEPASSDCTAAKRALHSARVTRKKYPLVSAEEYKKAAAAARRAGDTQLELVILREAANPPPDPPTDAELCAKLMGEARAYITAAEAAEREDPTCEGLTTAAERYFDVGKLFFRAIAAGQTKDQVLRSCPYQKTNEFLLRRDKLLYRVDDMRAQGLCDRRKPQPVVVKGGGTTQDTGNNQERRKECQAVLSKLERAAPNREWLINEMARSHCTVDGSPMTPAEIAAWEAKKKDGR
jgi:hypothetical protein